VHSVERREVLLVPDERIVRAPSPLRERFSSISVVILLSIIASWEVAARLQWISPWFFPPPSQIASYMASPSAAAFLADHAGATLRRVFTGLICGVAPAALLGMLIGWSSRLRRIVDPFLAALHPIPKIALLPLLIVIFGIGETPRIIAIAVGAFFPMALTAASGARQINPTFFEVARNYGATGWQVFRFVVVPASVPAMVVGVRLSFNVALLIAVSTEIAASRTGLGTILWLAWETFRIEQLYAALVVVSAIGIGFNIGWSLLSRILLRWQQSPA
jgi:NitT/TauT family transport system permease protein